MPEALRRQLFIGQTGGLLAQPFSNDGELVPGEGRGIGRVDAFGEIGKGGGRHVRGEGYDAFELRSEFRVCKFDAAARVQCVRSGGRTKDPACREQIEKRIDGKLDVAPGGKALAAAR